MTKFIYKGKFHSEEDLPKRPHEAGAVRFREPDGIKKVAIVANAIAIGMLIPLMILIIWRFLNYGGIRFNTLMPAIVAANVAFYPSLILHEFIHGLMFHGEVFMYENMKMGMLFVTGTENFTKNHFILMSAMPTIILGVIPYIIGMLNPALLGGFPAIYGALMITSAGGDVINIFNAATQMPKGSMCYMYGFRSYWFMPEE